ncbi:ABC transporter ATP-binding protein [Georgenia sp. Z1344]|uniref:ABC transporter ATP-binding protein n=1 Tax=Georgenia sp. Z1344 TaxID=3416706 RepID=UPI003CE7EB69
MTETIETTPSASRFADQDPILRVRDLTIEFLVDDEWFTAAEDLSYDVHPGEVLAIVGESGSGKTQSSMSLVGLLPPNGRTTGSARLGETELVGLRGQRLRNVRGDEIAVIFQEPMTALNPVYTVGFQIVETLRTHQSLLPAAAKKRAIELLTLVEIPEPARRFDSYPHQLSGGQRQRAMIAQALACNPRLLIADEPTTALDVTVQAEILKLMRDLRERIDAGIILITHDMGVVADMADTILVMKDGQIVERGVADEIFHRPQHPYTRQLLSSVPHLGSHTSADESFAPEAEDGTGGARPRTDRLEVSDRAAAPSPSGATAGTAEVTPVMRAEDVVLEYPKRGRQKAFVAAEDINLHINPGEVVGLVGESGSGKTTIGRAIVGLLPVKSGSLVVDGIEMRGANRSALKPLRSRVGMVFQDPGSSLNPRLPIGESIGEPLLLHTELSKAERNTRVEDLLDKVELPRVMRNRYPHELSGGQRQRVGIARALALEPTILVADEPTSALDVSVQARVLELFSELQRETGFACLFISHDLAVVEMLSSRIAVMHKGHLVETGHSGQVVNDPQHPYTQRLIAAVPVPDPDEQAKRRRTRDAVLEAYAKAGEDGEVVVDSPTDRDDTVRRAEERDSVEALDRLDNEGHDAQDPGSSERKH